MCRLGIQLIRTLWNWLERLGNRTLWETICRKYHCNHWTSQLSIKLMHALYTLYIFIILCLCCVQLCSFVVLCSVWMILFWKIFWNRHIFMRYWGITTTFKIALIKWRKSFSSLVIFDHMNAHSNATTTDITDFCPLEEIDSCTSASYSGQMNISYKWISEVIRRQLWCIYGD